MIDRLRAAGYQVEICKGFDAARNVLVNYIKVDCSGLSIKKVLP